jgi:hypothetical protein
MVGCDQGHQGDEPTGGSPVHVATSNVCPGQAPIAVNGGRIEVAFDRLLNPSCITRQTFFLKDKSGNQVKGPGPGDDVYPVAYDPIDRIVTIFNARLVDGQPYELDIIVPTSPTDQNGLRAIDGATLDAKQPLGCAPSQSKATLTFVATAAAQPPPAAPTVDFCKDIMPIFLAKCLTGACHGPGPPPTGRAEGLLLDTPSDVGATAIGLVAHEANTGARATARSADYRIFGADMPIVDPGSGPQSNGDPGDSWLIYKMLMAVPAATSSSQGAMSDGGAATPTPVTAFHSITAQPLSDSERLTLSNLVPGREMPYPLLVGAALSQNTQTLSLDELRLVSRWIAQTPSGTPLVPTCQQ